MSRLVTKCVCKRITFEEIKIETEKNDFNDLEDIMDSGIACTGCGMCIPYVKKMIATGETEFKPGDYHF